MTFQQRNFNTTHYPMPAATPKQLRSHQIAGTGNPPTSKATRHSKVVQSVCSEKCNVCSIALGPSTVIYLREV